MTKDELIKSFRYIYDNRDNPDEVGAEANTCLGLLEGFTRTPVRDAKEIAEAEAQMKVADQQRETLEFVQTKSMEEIIDEACNGEPDD